MSHAIPEHPHDLPEAVQDPSATAARVTASWAYGMSRMWTALIAAATGAVASLTGVTLGALIDPDGVFDRATLPPQVRAAAKQLDLTIE
jgi:hypothetical protein